MDADEDDVSRNDLHQRQLEDVVTAVVLGDEFPSEGGGEGDVAGVTMGKEGREDVVVDGDDATVENEIDGGWVSGVVEAGESGEFGQRVSGIGDQAKENVELVGSEDVTEADVGDDDVAVKGEGDGAEIVGGGDDERGVERKEDAVVVADERESGGFGEQVSGIGDLVKAALMEGEVEVAAVVYAEEMDGIETVLGSGNESGTEMKEDGVVVEDVGESGGFDGQVSGIGDQGVEEAELMESEDAMEADAEGTGMVVEEEMDRIETVLGGDDERGSERKEDLLAVPDGGECMELIKHVVGICDGELSGKVELMESVDVREMDAGVVDMVEDEEEDAVVGVNRDVIKEDEIDDEVTTGGGDDVVASGVDDSRAMKEEEVVGFVVEGDGTAMAEEEGVDVGSCDAMLDMEVVELKENEIGIATVDGSSCNAESIVRAVSLEVKESGIANVEGQISLAENEAVTDRGGLSKGGVLMVDEIATAEKDFCETYAASNTGATGAVVEDENETVDRIGVGDKELAKEVTGMSDKIGTEAVENAVLGDKDVDDVAEEQQVTEGVDRTETTAATEDTDMAEKLTEKVEQQERDALLNRKGRRTSKGGRASTKKKLDEDVCFICFDGGDLVLCDRRGCHKAYHPSCVDRDEPFFQTKDQWNCGWHFCSSCKKNAHYFCYTCTFSLCKGCIKDAAIYVVRGNKGFCDICIRTVKMIESVIKGDNQMGPADFDDKTSWEYLFKEYYMDLKEKISLSAEEIQEAKNPWKGADVNSRKEEFQDDTYDVNNGQVGSDDLAGQSTVSVPKKRKASKPIKSQAKERYLPKKSNGVGATEVSIIDGVKWATRELLEFVMHTRKGDPSVLSQYDVQALLLEYIKTNKLRDPRKKSQIICDSRLQNLFGKSRLGHFEMLKLLESHFLVKDDTDDLQGSVVDTGTNLADVDQEQNASFKSGKQKKSKTKKRGNDRGLQSNIDDYAAIDTHNITLIYLRRSLVEYLLEDAETFDDKVIGSFVRIRIPGNTPKLEMYRLVPIIGTSKVPKPYKVGKKQTDYVLDIQNFGKTEKVQIDIISNQEFTQEECIRLKQSMKYGIINRLTVGDIQDKAISLQEVRVKDGIDAEIVRLSHLRDRASEIGHAKEYPFSLRECVEKLQLLKTPQERQRRLNKVPEIHADPKMDPNNESDDDEDILTRGRSTASGGRSQDPISPSKVVSALTETWRDGPRTPLSRNTDITRSMSGKGLEGWNEDGIRGGSNGNQIWNKPSNLSSDIAAGTNTRLRMEPATGFAPETPVASRSLSMQEATPMVNESEKMWQYKDPSGKIHGPFSMVQLRKWNNTGYFPVALRIWRSSETQDDSILLADALKGKYQRDTPRTVVTDPAIQFQYSLREPVRDHVMPSVTPSSMDIPKISGSQWSSTRNLSSPTPLRTAAAEVNWPHASSLQNSSAVAHSSAASLINNGGMSGADVLRNVSSVLAQDPNALMNAASALLAQSQSALSGQQRSTVETHVQNAQAPQTMNPGLAIQNLVQVVQSPNPTVNAWGWGSAPASSSDHAKQPPVSGQWGEQNPASYGTGGSTSAMSNAWRTNPGEQPSMESAAVPGVNWAASNNTTNLFASSVAVTSSSSLQNANPTWVQGPGNTSWVASAPGNGNGNWSANPIVSRAQGPGMMPGWNPPIQGQSFGNTTNAGAMPSNQAPPHDMSPGWPGQGYQGSMMGETSSNDGRYRERADYGYGGGRTWNGQSSFGGGVGGARDQGICWYQDEYGNCRRGAFCKFRHAGAGGSGNLQ
ncbi:hypothetical protein MLD38_032321 [Melastoma candidum]|uniref:Uncharacterized protein n=1 Tax=Melastoma candidum TaxID=119954 RepID=A0ACB9M4J9_9MYRT|nr:hypothetical protein MLD38_032321 [Melastoma candidum]